MARNPENASPHLGDTGSSDERKPTKRKKRGSFAAPLPTEPVSKPAEARPKQKPSALDEALANLAIKKQETAEEPSTTDKKESQKETAETDKPVDETATEPAETSPDTTTPEEDETDQDAESYDKLKDQEVEPNRLSGGEVIIQLQGVDAVSERVILLHDEPEHSEEAPTDTAASTEQEQTAEQPPNRHEEQAQPTDDSAPNAETLATPAEQIVVQTPVIVSREVVPPLPPESSPPQPEQYVAAAPQPAEVFVAEETVQPRPEDIYEPVLQQPEVSTPQVVGGERPATKQEVEDALYYATKTGQNRGVLAGLLVGSGYEHFKHKRREKRQEKRFKKQTKQVDQSRKDQHFFYEQQVKHQSENQRRFANLEQRTTGPAKPEQQRTTNTERPQLEAPEQQLAIPADHRLETSAWHSIEVDNKTGKPVEHPAFTYGKEYYRERAQEASPKQQRNAAAGEVALVAAAMAQNGSDEGSNASSSAPSIPLASKKGAPSKVAALKSSVKSLGSSSDSNQGPLWPWLVALVVVVICLVIAIG